MNVSWSDKVSKFEMFEVVVEGPKEGNPFFEQKVEGIFSGRYENVNVHGFYDGDGIFRVRFMPRTEGMHSFMIRTSFSDEAYTGRFFVEPNTPTVHGPLHVSDTTHFAYEDGTTFPCIGVTADSLVTECEERIEETFASLKSTGMNKVRFLAMPCHDRYHLTEPDLYPYEGTPMDSSVLTVDNYKEYTGKFKGSNWDFTKPNYNYFKRIDRIVERLGDMGIEAEIVLFSPHDRWGFSGRSREADDLYLNYMIDRYSAYRNIWWCVAEEYDRLPKTVEDFEHYANLLVKRDVFGHLRTITNGRLMYDYSRSWITHCSLMTKNPEETDALLVRYRKPIVLDRLGCEGKMEEFEKALTAEEMLHRMWTCVVRGGYPAFGEAIPDESGKFFASHGGNFFSWSAEWTVPFLMDMLSKFDNEIAPIETENGVLCGKESEWEKPVGSLYLFYTGVYRPAAHRFHFDDTTHFKVSILHATGTNMYDGGIYKGDFTLALEGFEYTAILLERTNESCRAPENPVNQDENEEETDNTNPEATIEEQQETIKDETTPADFDVPAFMKRTIVSDENPLDEESDTANLELPVTEEAASHDVSAVEDDELPDVITDSMTDVLHVLPHEDEAEIPDYEDSDEEEEEPEDDDEVPEEEEDDDDVFAFIPNNRDEVETNSFDTDEIPDIFKE